MDTTTIILLTLILAILTFCMSKSLFTSWNYWTSRGIPSVPGALPVFGHALPIFLMQDNLTTLCTKIYNKYHDKSMVGFYKFKTPVLMIKDPDLVKTVLQTRFKNFAQNGAALDLDLDPLLGHDPCFLQEFQGWKDARATFSSTLSPKRIKSMSLAVTNVCKILENHLAEKIKNKDHLELEAKFLFSRYTAEVAAAAIFGIEGNSFQDDYRGTLLECMKITMDPTTMKMLKHNTMLFLPKLGFLFNASFVPSKVNTLFNRIVKGVEDLRQKDDIPRNDVLQLMFDMVKNGKIEKIEGLGHAFSFLLESYETSSLTLSFMSYFIAKYPDIQNKIRAEVETTLDKYEGQLTYEAINEMSYLEQVMNESMRFYPAVGALDKVCVEAYRLEGSDGLTLDVEPGTTLYIPIAGLQMDPEYWKNPEEFNPERFAKGNREERHNFTYLPFSEGPRNCPGQRFGILQVKAAMATILRNYCIELSSKMIDPVRIDPGYFLTTAAGGSWIKLRPLKNKSCVETSGGRR